MSFLDTMFERSDEVAKLNRASAGFAGCALPILPTGLDQDVQSTGAKVIIRCYPETVYHAKLHDIPFRRLGLGSY